MISIIVAISDNNAIGIGNALPWKLPNDMKRFKELTTGHTVVMGRKTFESLPKGALPNRRNIVVTTHPEISFAGCEMYNDLWAAASKYESADDIFIIGGASIYGQAMGFADRMYVTRVHHVFEDADTFFPNIDMKRWDLAESESFPQDGRHAYPYTFQTYIKKK